MNYQNGEGVERDIKKVNELYQQAADLGNSKAMFNLGFNYQNGEGVEKDFKKAHELYQKAADLL